MASLNKVKNITYGPVPAMCEEPERMNQTRIDKGCGKSQKNMRNYHMNMIMILTIIIIVVVVTVIVIVTVIIIIVVVIIIIIISESTRA